jgi:hypothetical protein
MPYILINAVSVKERLRLNEPDLVDKVQHFWELAKNKALLDGSNYRFIAFSDSLLVHISEKDKLLGSQLLEWIRNTMEFLRLSGLDFYSIANCGEDVGPDAPDDAMASSDYQGEPSYIHIAGLGDDFADLFVVDKEIQRLRVSGKLPDNVNTYVNEMLLTPDLKYYDNSFIIKSITGNTMKYFFFP